MKRIQKEIDYLILLCAVIVSTLIVFPNTDATAGIFNSFHITVNKFTGSVNEVLSFEPATSVNLTIYDNAGVVVSSRHTGQIGTSYSADLPEGTYFIRPELEGYEFKKNNFNFAEAFEVSYVDLDGPVFSSLITEEENLSFSQINRVAFSTFPLSNCGDFSCDSGETHITCASDCLAPLCGDGYCTDEIVQYNPITGEPINGGFENYDNCLVDCPNPACGDGECTNSSPGVGLDGNPIGGFEE